MPELNFDAMIEELQTGLVGPGDLDVWGGKFQPDLLSDFLAAWGLPSADLPWNLWEWVHGIALERGKRPGDLDLLERGRIFGPGGDLSLRRDGERWWWHFTGPAGTRPPANFDAADFWADHPGLVLRAREEHLLLWGEEHPSRPGHWQEDRVGRATLVYPDLAGTRRVAARVRLYTDAGSVALVWWHGLEADHGNG